MWKMWGFAILMRACKEETAHMPSGVWCPLGRIRCPLVSIQSLQRRLPDLWISGTTFQGFPVSWQTTPLPTKLKSFVTKVIAYPISHIWVCLKIGTPPNYGWLPFGFLLKPPKSGYKQKQHPYEYYFANSFGRSKCIFLRHICTFAVRTEIRTGCCDGANAEVTKLPSPAG